METTYAERPAQLSNATQVVDGMYYWQGLVRGTRRVVNGSDRTRYLDLHPAEEVLLRMLNGQHTLADINQRAAQLQALDNRLPVRSGTDLVVQLDGIGVLA